MVVIIQVWHCASAHPQISAVKDNDDFHPNSSQQNVRLCWIHKDGRRQLPWECSQTRLLQTEQGMNNLQAKEGRFYSNYTIVGRNRQTYVNHSHATKKHHFLILGFYLSEANKNDLIVTRLFSQEQQKLNKRAVWQTKYTLAAFII